MEDLECIEAIAAGGTREPEYFVDEYLPVVLRAFRYKQVPEQDMEDLVQDFFTHLAEGNYRRLRSWRGESSLTTWLTLVAKRFAIDYFRRQRPIEPLDEGDSCARASPAQAGLEQLQWLREQRRLINGILDYSLSRREADLLRRRFYADQTTAEIATELGMNDNSVRVATHRALEKLRQKMPAELILQGNR